MNTPAETPPAKDTARAQQRPQHNNLDELRLDMMMAHLRDERDYKNVPAPRYTQIDGVLQIDTLIAQAKHAVAEKNSRAS